MDIKVKIQAALSYVLLYCFSKFTTNMKYIRSYKTQYSGNIKFQQLEPFWNIYPDTADEVYLIWFSNSSVLKENKLQHMNSKYCCKPITCQ
jgi:hypothetical protein